MGRLSFRSVTFMFMVTFLVWSSLNVEFCNARRGKHWRQHGTTSSVSLYKKKGKNHGSNNHHKSGGKPKPKYASPPPISPPSKGYDNVPSTNIFDVTNFGAVGDGKTDDTKAFQAAWAAACKVEDSTMLVPSKYVFLVGPISFSGPYCQHNIVFQLDGTIIAPTDAKSWGSGIMQWLEFTKLVGITVKGSGVIDGRGSVWWQDTPYDDPLDDELKLIIPLNKTLLRHPLTPINSSLSGKMPSIKPTALRFYGSFNVTVTGITIQNSQQCHLKFDNCIGVLVNNFTVSSPGDSPNTDGIHLQNSKDAGEGVESISIDSKEKKLTITGNIDPVSLVSKLRKLCHTDIVSVGPAKEPEKKKDDGVKKDEGAKKDDGKKDDGAKKGDDKKGGGGGGGGADKTKEEALPVMKAFPAPIFYHYNQNPYQHYQTPVPAYYHQRSVEEDPNSCVIC